ncbi:hypothetical protein [Flavobacterium sp. UGB4466]|uniref:hypothetical protein n=1 Tax=Flavobacterium sp. UGB4466 TaxID=2730889 RepID=UPI00192B350C|nr:hypothetical protein [Flavobacterium sp. UGB4466]
MADITETQVREYIATELANESDIPAVRHRAVENKLMDFIVQELAKVAKSKVLILDSFTTDRNYSLATELPANSIIDNVTAMLVCKNAVLGFAQGDVVTSPTPYPYDAGRTAAQGIGVLYNNFSNSTVKIMVNDQLTIMGPYKSEPNATADPILISGSGTANWSIKLIVGYKQL